MVDTRDAGLRPIELLFVEDNPGDVLLCVEELKFYRIANNLNVVWDGIEALNFLRREGKYSGAPRPDMIFTDLKLPRMDGHQLVHEIKCDPALRGIPVVILTSSDADTDILTSYDNEVNTYIKKPLDFPKLMEAIRSVDNFWLTAVRMVAEKQG